MTLNGRPTRKATPRLTAREREVRTARRVLSDERLIAFFRAAGKVDAVTALTLINEQLDEGQSLDEIFFTEWREGYELSAVRIGDSTFKIAFGCHAGPLAGDGGEWRVAFVGNDVRALLGGTYWIS